MSVVVFVLAAILLGLVYIFYQYNHDHTVQDCDRHSVLIAAINDADAKLRLSTVDLAEALRIRTVTSVEMVNLYIKQVETCNPYINAVCSKRYEGARAEARLADERLDTAVKDPSLRDTLPAFLGVPYIVKELHEYPGMSYTCGIPGREGMVGQKMHPVLKRMETAGGIALVSGNVSEGAMWAESFNPIYGYTHNPYDLTRTVGGSSGGNSALVTALCGSFSITADVGGSTRIPAMYNGVFGHKPSGGAIPNARSWPPCHGKVERYCQLGPTTRYAKDLMPLLRIMSHPLDISTELPDADAEERAYQEEQVVWHRKFDWPDVRTVDTKKLRYFVCYEQPGVVVGMRTQRSQCVINAQNKIVRTLERECGVTVQPITFNGFKKCFDIWAAMLGTANAKTPFKGIISQGKDTISPFWELLKWVVTWGRASDHTLPAIGLACAEVFNDLDPKRKEEMIKLGEELRDEINAVLGDDGVMVFQSLPTPAARHGALPNLLYFADYAT
ncbi:hypothetical protein SARC_11197, partial [Sphaeroforma arctica JP610]